MKEDNKNNLVFESNKKINKKASKDTTKSGSLQYQKEKPEKKEPKTSPKDPKEKIAPRQKIIYILKVFILSILGVALSGSIILGIIIGNWLKDVPELDLSLLTDVSQTSLIYDKNGELLASYSSYENREWVSIDEIPQYLKDAIISVEDKRFYSHPGIDFKRLGGAILGQLSGGADYGGSTLTQQLIKNVYLTSEVTYKRKAQEIYLALQLENKMSKDEILEAYLNIIYLGSSNYGVKSAAKDYFNKDLDELTLRECAMLAGLTQNPNGYNPRKNMLAGDMTKTNTRTDDVLWAMHENGKITDEEYTAALNEEVSIREESINSEMYPYAHYIEYVLEEVATDLLKQEGKEVNETNLAYKKYSIRNGGYKIYTTLDPSIQETLQETAANFTEYPDTADGNPAQVSAVIMDQHTGEIVAMIGSREEPTAQETFNRAVDSVQPIGSIMKPITIFAPAIELGYSPASVVADYKSNIDGYDGGYPGGSCSSYPTTMRAAIENSHNIPAAQFLSLIGIDTASNFLTQLGINPSHISKTGSGIALGTSDLTTLETTGAYAAIANDGTYIEPHAYTIVTNRKGEEILNATDNSVKRRVFSESTAWLTTDMLRTEVSSGGGVNAQIDGITVAGKTGTHESKCITFAGFTGYYTSVVRISSDSYADIYNASGGKQTAKLWQQYMSKIHEGLEDKPLQTKTAEALNLIQVEVCNISGQLATDACKASGHAISDYFKNGNQPTKKCEMHITVCTTTGLIAHEGCYDKGTTKILTYIPDDSYLAKIDKDLISATLENVTYEKPTEECYYNHYYVEPEPEPEPEEPVEPEVPEEPINPDEPFEPEPEPEPEEPIVPEVPEEPNNPIDDLLDNIFGN